MACREARDAFVPQPVMGKTAEQLRAYVDGKNPISGRPVMQEVIEGLTRPLDEDGIEGDQVRALARRGWSTPTPKTTCSGCSSTITGPTSCRSFCRRKSASRRCSRTPAASRTKSSGHMRSTQFREHWEYTVEKVAVNAVMAGARPEYFPVILALAATGVSARGSTTSSMAAMVVVNGPIRNEIGMNCGHRRHGPYNHANATIGRAYGLLSQNLPGRLGARRQLHGLPGQQLRLQQRDLRRERGAQPVGAVPRAAWLQADRQHGERIHRLPLDGVHPRRAREILARARAQHAARHGRRTAAPTFLLDPIAARQFIDRGGFDTKEKLIDWVYENALMPAGEYWDYQLIQNYIYPRATFGEEPYASKLKAGAGRDDPHVQAREIHVVVVGGETNGYWRIMGCNYQKTVSVDEWR